VTPKPLPFVSVVVPVRNAERTLADCLRSLMQVDYPVERREILVVDNGSTDATARIISAFSVTQLAESHRGPSPARNRGILASCGEIVALVDADCVVTRRWLRALVAAFDGPDVSGAAGEVLAYPPDTWAEYYMARRRPRWQAAALTAARPYAVTANVAFRRRVFDQIGLFDPRFVTGQDQDFSWRFFWAGLTLRYVPAAVVFHRHRAGPWAFARQQVAWARGSAQLRRWHRVPHGFRGELAEYRKLAGAAMLLLVAAFRGVAGGTDRAELYYRLYDVLRELTYRGTTLACAVRAAGRRISGDRG
jgi:cellulose synthase/poly-beta-1,6-N-acetylglucosamine synthase-like glycosyltransferase